jgi:hypothetical protein
MNTVLMGITAGKNLGVDGRIILKYLKNTMGWSAFYIFC